MNKQGRQHHLRAVARFTVIAAALFAISAGGLTETGCGSAKVTSTATVSVSTATAGRQTTTIQTTPVDLSTLVSPTTPFPSAFRSPFDEQSYLLPQPVDLGKVAFLDKVSLSATEKEALARQSFVAVLPAANERPWKFWQVYEGARYQGLPLLVTTDSILNAYHSLFDTILQRMEEKALFDKAIVMTDALSRAAFDQWSAATNPQIKADARLNMAYFAVAETLLKGSNGVPGIVTGDVKKELQTILDLANREVSLIEDANGLEKSLTLGYTEDYSQYKPRGHYTRSETLKRYFKTMMWYGHTAFFINPSLPDRPEELANSLTRRAVLIAFSLTGATKEAWKAIYEPTTFLVGLADDLTVDDVQDVIAQVFGGVQPAPDDLSDAVKITALRQELNKLRAPKILTQMIRAAEDTTGREESERSFRVMGQRYIPDSYAFQQLVWAYVGTQENKRDLPMGLDAMAVLGSDQAYEIAKQDYAQDKYK
ncbi:MAG: DUF3160 domain-containing protein, partial [Actinobacteria bacterium]|nr:DUF3160 domain-containing protein [Actinomycetota bacterium]